MNAAQVLAWFILGLASGYLAGYLRGVTPPRKPTVPGEADPWQLQQQLFDDILRRRSGGAP